MTSLLLALAASALTVAQAGFPGPAPGGTAVSAPAQQAPQGVGPSGKLEPLAAAASPAPEVVDVVERLGEKLPLELGFLDGYQNRIKLGELLQQGKPVLLTLVYFDCPLLCSTLLNGVVKGLNESGLQLGKDFTAVTVSFSPKDSPRESAMYQAGYLKRLVSAEKAHAQDWVFLTGTAGAITSLTQSVGFQYRYDAPTQQFEHPAVAMVITPDGRISRYLYGVQFPPRDLRLAVVEASGGKVGTSFDRVLLKCFRYDPASRKYHLYVFAFVRAGAALVFVALATFMFVLWRREFRLMRSTAPKKGTAA